MSDAYVIYVGPEPVPADRQQEMRELAEAARSAFLAAGLPAVVSRSGEPAPGIEIEIEILADRPGVFAVWAEAPDLREAVVFAMAEGRLDDPAIEQAGAIAEAMRTAMLAVLLATGFSARSTGDEPFPYAVEILAAE